MMKKIIKIIGIVSILLVGVTSNAATVIIKPSPSVKIKSVNSGRFRLYVKTLEGDSTVEIKDGQGKIVLSETLKKGYIYRKVYDISKLSSGVYYVKISDKKSTVTYAVSKDKITLLEDSSSKGAKKD